MAPKACRQKAVCGRHALLFRKTARMVGWCLLGQFGCKINSDSCPVCSLHYCCVCR